MASIKGVYDYLAIGISPKFYIKYYPEAITRFNKYVADLPVERQQALKEVAQPLLGNTQESSRVPKIPPEVRVRPDAYLKPPGEVLRKGQITNNRATGSTRGQRGGTGRLDW